MPSANRGKTEAFILKWIGEMIPGPENQNIYKRLFASMSDKDFDLYMKDLESGKRTLAIYSPNLSKTSLKLERNLAIAKKLGHNFFERIWIGAKGNTPAYLTPIPYMVIDLPLRRASQMLIKKLAVADNNKSIDNLTGQLSSATKGCKVSLPELQVLSAMGCDSILTELIKYRGGDAKGLAAMNSMISRYGTANLKTLSGYSGGVESVRTFRTFLTAMHLKNEL